MVKHEIKVEISQAENLRNIIEKAYYEDGFGGKLIGKKHYLVIDEDDDVNYTIFKGLNNATVKVTNEEVIDGSMRFVVDESEGDIRLYPISIYCVKEDRYSFY